MKTNLYFLSRRRSQSFSRLVSPLGKDCALAIYEHAVEPLRPLLACANTPSSLLPDPQSLISDL